MFTTGWLQKLWQGIQQELMAVPGLPALFALLVFGAIFLYLSRKKPAWLKLRWAGGLVSLIYLGFILGGCFCTIGAFQSLVNPGEAATAPLSVWLLFLIPLAAGVFWGKVFCGWACPLGFLQEGLYKLRQGILRLPGVKFSAAALSTTAAGEPSRRWIRIIVRWMIVIIILGLAVAGFRFRYAQVDPFRIIFQSVMNPAAALEYYRNAWDWLNAIGVLLTGVLVITAFIWFRPWCRWICPLGTVLSVVPGVRRNLTPHILTDRLKCTTCQACRRKCPMGALTMQRGSGTQLMVDPYTCIDCGECLPACRSLQK